MDLGDAIQRVVGNPGEIPELHQRIVAGFGGDSQKIGLALGALRMAAEAVRVLASLGVGVEFREVVKEPTEPTIVEQPKSEASKPNFDQPVGRRHK